MEKKEMEVEKKDEEKGEISGRLMKQNEDKKGRDRQREDTKGAVVSSSPSYCQIRSQRSSVDCRREI